MAITRRNYLFGAGAASLQMAATSPTRAAENPKAKDPALGPPEKPSAALLDKASFPAIQNTTYMNSAATHPVSVGSMRLAEQAARAEFDRKPGDFFPNNNRVLAHFAELINAAPEEVEFVPSTQVGESFIAAALGLPQSGAHVISDALHYDGAQMMYLEMQKRGADVTFIPMSKDGKVPIEEYERHIRPGKTKLIALSATSMLNGFTQDLKSLCQLAHSKNVFVHADIIQLVGNTPIDVKDSGVDSACAATYKWLMSRGTAFLYVSSNSTKKLAPPFYHISNYEFPLPHETPSTKLSWPDTHMYPYDTAGKQIVDNYVPKKGARGMFSLGYTPNLSTIAGLEYSLPYIKNIGVERIHAHRKPLIERLKEQLPKKGYRLLTPVDSDSPIVTVAVRDAGRLDPFFDRANVKVTTRWNHVRVSPSIFNDMEDVERVLAAFPISDSA